MNAPSSSSDRDPLERLAAEFLDRRRRGENPSPSEYAEQYPQWAEQILEFFPALEVMEGLKPGPGDQTALARGPGRGCRRSPAGAARRVPHPPRDRPRRHGRRLRGRPGVAGPARRLEDPAAARPDRPGPDGAIPARVALGGAAAPRPTSCRSTAWASTTACTTTRCSTSRGTAWT